MHKKLTITIDEGVYRALHRVVGRGSISRFIEDLVRPHVIDEDLDSAYREMAEDAAREAEAFHWAEGTISDFGGDFRDEPR